MAILMFLSLVILWTISLIPNSFFFIDQNEGSELVVMAIPAGLALAVMYRLVPLHKLIKCMRIISAEQKRREAARAQEII